MTGLKELQEKFQRGILAGDDEVLTEINDSAREKRKTLFGVYRYAYVARLAEILAEDYEMLHTYVGDATFAKLVKCYIGAHPSDRRSARDFGRHMPEFLSTTSPFAAHRELAEIAALEKALADAFDAADAAPLALTQLAEVAPEGWPRLVFAPHPTAGRLTFATNAAEIWSALHNGAAPLKAETLAEPQAILVWRQDVTARFRPIGAEEAMMWDEAVQGTRFGVLCEMVATFAGEDGAELRAATYLKDWADTGMLAGCKVEAPPSR
jgi:Putative DNA-binding domain